jgi:hydrogenase maturation factor/phosphoglycolate phosphatase-like HAD superfamily hydrolase
MKDRPIQIKAVFFRMEGIFVQQSQQEVKLLKTAIGCPLESSLLEFIQDQLRSAKRKVVMSDLAALEIKAVANLNLNPALLETIQYLISKDIRLGVISHTCMQATRDVLRNFQSFCAADIDVVISRDEFLQQAPNTNLIGLAAEKTNTPVENVVLVSAHASDIQAGQQTGVITVFVGQRQKSEPMALTSDFEIEDIKDLESIIQMGTPLPAGKLPNELLRDFLSQFSFDDPTVLINPGIGEDIAAVDVTSQEVLVLKSDPITFATDSIGQYAVVVNANDIATSGATPKWFLTTLFFPCGTTASQIRHVVEELKEFCERCGITLCGGHTEITDAVGRPIIAGMMAGTVAKCDLIDKRNIEKGDRVLLTKALAVEGTAIIAREFGARLRKLGMPLDEIDHCRRFLDNISVMAEAKIAAATTGTTAMHDITEGGLATALEELSIAGSHKIKIYTDKVPVFPATRKICDLLDINPLGLIGSGSLLICCRTESCEKLMADIGDAGIDIACIGEVIGKGQGVNGYKGSRQVNWPSFEVDEITKLF